MTLYRKNKNYINSDFLFQFVLNRSLIYNSSWEDPAIDRQYLNIKSNDKVAMITSAGCNVLDILLDKPGSIHTADINFRQNALLELKIAAIKYTDYQTLFELFGKGRFKDFRSLYFDLLRNNISDTSKSFWDSHYNFFTDKNSLYYHGATGKFAIILNKMIDSKKGLREQIDSFFNSNSLDEQADRYNQFEENFWNFFTTKIINTKFALSFLGIPKVQREKIEDNLGDFLRKKLEHTFINIEIGTNYFWRLYFYGEYSKECSPEYLKYENFETLRKNIDKIHIYNSDYKTMLDKHTGYFSHFLLLDHQDWLDEKRQLKEWASIFRSAKSNAKFTARSVSNDTCILRNPNIFIDTKLSNALNLRDRVGTYKSLYLGCIL